jgi:hypothetical protein
MLMAGFGLAADRSREELAVEMEDRNMASKWVNIYIGGQSRRNDSNSLEAEAFDTQVEADDAAGDAEVVGCGRFGDCAHEIRNNNA